MPVDYRQRAFKAKFTSASKHLGVDPDQVISLKLRDMVRSYQEYRDMLHVLALEAGLHWTEVDGELQGQGYLLDHDGQKIIVVEHETGLEILYIAASVASLVGLIPLVLRAWGSIRGYLDRGQVHHFRGVEIRRLDGRGRLCEDHSRGLAGPSAFPLSVLNTALSAAARALDTEVHALRKEVRQLSRRVSALEKELKPKKTPTKRRPNKSTQATK